MTWFFAILIVALIGGVAVVASGRGGTMAEVFDDRPDAEVPAEGPLTAFDLRRVTFSTALRGYRMAEVDALLDRLAAELEPQGVRRPENGEAQDIESGSGSGSDSRVGPSSGPGSVSGAGSGSGSGPRSPSAEEE